MNGNEPRYITLYRSGELERRVLALEVRLDNCDICPRACHVRRTKGETGACNSGYLPIISSFCAHHGEEPVLSGSRGSGTIFFGNCNMRCVYCQNYQISQEPEAQKPYEVEPHVVAERMLYLQNVQRCHNINLVSPSHFVPQIARAVLIAVPMGLKIPIVYNTGSYDSVETLHELDSIIDIYLADIRYASSEWATKFSQVSDYVKNSRAAIKEMQRQVGDLIIDAEGIAQKGLIIRHLILPNRIAGSEDSLRWLVKEVSPKITVSIMSQYYPTHQAHRHPLLARKILPHEYEEVVRLADDLNIVSGWIQGRESTENYLPDFSNKNPFSVKIKKGR